MKKVPSGAWFGPSPSINLNLRDPQDPEFSSLVWIKVDVDENEQAAGECGIQAMPTFQVYKNGEKQGEMVGASKDKLIELARNFK